MKAVNSSNMLVSIYKFVWCYKPGDSDSIMNCSRPSTMELIDKRLVTEKMI
jgi:hypothetical protein